MVFVFKHRFASLLQEEGSVAESTESSLVRILFIRVYSNLF